MESEPALAADTRERRLAASRADPLSDPSRPRGRARRVHGAPTGRFFLSLSFFDSSVKDSERLTWEVGASVKGNFTSGFYFVTFCSSMTRRARACRSTLALGRKTGMTDCL